MVKNLRKLFGAQDMTVGSPFVCLLKFSIPMLIGNLAQMLYTTVDRVIVGQYVRVDIPPGMENIPGIEDAALGAVGLSMPILNLFFVFFMAIGSGVTVMVSQFFGAKDKENLSRSIGNSITLIIIASIVVTAVAAPLTGPILRLMGAKSPMYEMAYSYLFILFLGLAFNGFYNVLSGILRGLGDAIYPLVVLLITVVINVFLDIWFVAPWGLDMGIAGAAYATIISQCLAAAACLARVLRQKDTFKINRAALKLHAFTVKQIARLGLPSGIQMAVMFASNIIMQPFILAMGPIAIPAQTATMSVDGFAIMPAQAFSMAASTYTGQNIGAGNMERVKKGTKTVFLMCFAFSALMAACIQIFGVHIFRLFTDTDQMIALCRRFVLILCPAYLIMSVNMSFNGVMRGAGDAVGTMWISVLTNVILRVPLTFVFIFLTRGTAWTWKAGAEPIVWENGSPDAMFFSILISMTIGSIITMLYYRAGKWKNKGVVRKRA